MWYKGSKALRHSRVGWGLPSGAIRPVYTIGLDTGWYDVNKAAKLPAARV